MVEAYQEMNILTQEEEILQKFTENTILHHRLSSMGKVLTFLQVCWNLPGYLGVTMGLFQSQRGHSHEQVQQERIRQVEKQSWTLMLLSVICYSIWTSFAFKQQCIEIAVVCVFCK